MTHTLIATLGRSPGAITGLVHALHEERPADIAAINRVCVLRTTHPDVRRAGGIIRDTLTQHFTALAYEEIELSDKDFVDTQASAFQKLITDTIQQEIGTGQQIIMGIAGGRTSMGAMLAMSSQIYDEVTHIYHMWVVDSLESNGDIERLNLIRSTDTTTYKNILLPDRNQRALVPIPRLPVQQHMVQLRQKVESNYTLEPDGTSVLAELDDILSLLPRRLTVGQAREFVRILRVVEAGEPVANDALLNVMKGAGITGADEIIRTLLHYARRDDDAITLVGRWVDDVNYEKPYWGRGLGETWAKHREDVATGAAVAAVFLQLLALHFQIIAM